MPTAPAPRPSSIIQSGVSVDAAGNVYVCDTYDTIRKITPAGVVTTFAGTAGQGGSADGTGAAAQFTSPEGTAVDAAGNVYVADTVNDTIRKITPAGVVTTLAGTAGQGGSADGTGAAAHSTFPTGVAVDGAGNVYVADSYNDTIRKITPAGVVTTLAGTAGQSGSADGTGAAARFNTPSGMAVDGAGNVYVADEDNDDDPQDHAGRGRDHAGRGGGPVAAPTAPVPQPGFNQPRGLAVDDAGNVYVADTGNDMIRKITPAGVVTTLAGRRARRQRRRDWRRGTVQHPVWCGGGRHGQRLSWWTRSTTRSARCPTPRSSPRAA